MGEIADSHVDQMMMPDEDGYERSDYSDTCHCAVCGRFVRHIWAERTEEKLIGVWAKCKAHGKVEVKRFVDGEHVGWSWEDFDDLDRVAEGVAGPLPEAEPAGNSPSRE